MKIPNRLVWLDTRVWNTWIAICLGDPKQWKRGLRRANVPATEQERLYDRLIDQRGASARIVWNDDFRSYVFMQFYPNVYRSDPVKLYGSIAHEAFHAAHRILTTHGITLTDSSEEAYAYLTEHIVRTIHYELRRK